MRSRDLRHALSFTLTGSILCIVVVSPAFATLRTAERARPLAVSVPDGAIPVAAGHTADISIRVVNPGTEAVPVTITGRGLHFGNNGRVTMSSQSDPEWAGRVDFPTRPIEVPANAYVPVRLRVAVPTGLAPDLYFIGFVVTPSLASDAGLRYVNQIASYLTINVPGPRVRKLTARLVGPGWRFSDHATAQLTIDNIGHTAAIYWGEQDTSATPGTASPVQARFAQSLLPAGRIRSVSVSARSGWPISFVTMHIRLIYPTRTDATTTEIDLSRRVLVIDPTRTAALLAALITATVAWVLWRRRTRTARTRVRGHGKPRARYAGR